MFSVRSVFVCWSWKKKRDLPEHPGSRIFICALLEITMVNEFLLLLLAGHGSRSSEAML